MPFISKHTFRTESYGRSIADEGWEELEPEHIALWKAALDLLKIRTLELPACVVKIEANWEPILRKHQQHYRVMKRLQQGFKGDEDLLSIAKRFPSRAARIEFKTEVVGGDKLSTDSASNLASTAIELYLHDLFLILNICAPGSCDFYRGELLKEGSRKDFSLSNFHFELAILGSFKKDWPRIQNLPLAETLTWFESVRSGVRQLPQNAMEKVLFALLHISKLETDPMIVIWLFYAFESLFQTRAGENFSTLIQRIALLLDLEESQLKTLRSKFRSLYDIRSGIAHGGFEVSHPMHNELLDGKVDDNYERIANAAEYGLTTLLAAVQSSILHGWRYPTFSERLEGVAIK